MKKLLFALTLILATTAFVACSDDDDDVKVTVNDLPENAQEFLITYFPGQEARLVEKDNDSYDVYLKNGFDIDFTLDGVWDDVDGNGTALPPSVIDLVPVAIPDYVTANYAGQNITEINKETFGFEVELTNRTELEFDKDGNFLRIDK
ncbi:MAG: PepSY-like domain-containing protein [Dysgonomonas sp.]|nr:PepSY-like domain-containing protein [Dysgonomonas sp.]